MMNDLGALEVLISLLAGLVAGGLFFGGLWLTVKRLPDSPHAGLLVLGSLVIRTAIVVVIFYLVMNGSWERLLLCLAGFVVARMAIIRNLNPNREAS